MKRYARYILYITVILNNKLSYVAVSINYGLYIHFVLFICSKIGNLECAKHEVLNCISRFLIIILSSRTARNLVFPTFSFVSKYTRNVFLLFSS